MAEPDPMSETRSAAASAHSVPTPLPPRAPSRRARSKSIRVRVGLLERLGAITTVGGELIGDVYARTARALLGRLEQLEDTNAERRFRVRSRSAPPGQSQTTARPEPSSKAPAAKH